MVLCRTSQAVETVRRDIPLSTRPLSGVTLPIEGHLKLSKQVELVRVGGHSPGQMAVFVGTAKGRACIASDFLYNYTNLRHDWPIGPVWNMDEWISGLRFISLGLRYGRTCRLVVRQDSPVTTIAIALTASVRALV